MKVMSVPFNLCGSISRSSLRPDSDVGWVERQRYPSSPNGGYRRTASTHPTNHASLRPIPRSLLRGSSLARLKPRNFDSQARVPGRADEVQVLIIEREQRIEVDAEGFFSLRRAGRPSAGGGPDRRDLGVNRMGKLQPARRLLSRIGLHFPPVAVLQPFALRGLRGKRDLMVAKTQANLSKKRIAAGGGQGVIRSLGGDHVKVELRRLGLVRGAGTP